jgi:hypothetical protein
MYSSGWEPPVRKVKFEVMSSSANMREEVYSRFVLVWSPP